MQTTSAVCREALIIKWISYSITMCFLIFLNCNEQKKTTNKILSKPEMANTILAMYLIEAKIDSVSVTAKADSCIILKKDLKEKMSNITSDSILNTSYSYYLSRPEEMTEVIDIIIDTLSLWEQRMHTRGDTISGKDTTATTSAFLPLRKRNTYSTPYHVDVFTICSREPFQHDTPIKRTT